ncbi:hypothetical protein SNE40_001725 [Patella caerulea]|uniref:XRCC4 n=1 Tax=Patella caerulea TaxID=87958 RepID=A0AAN8QDJ3_PATCE
MSKKVLSKITTVGSQQFFLLTTIPVDKEDGFNLLLTDGQSTWTGTFSADNMDKQRKRLKMDFTSYFNQTEKAFIRDDDDVNFEYSVKIKNGDTAELVWKKHVTSDDIKFQLGSITLMLKDDPVTGICTILNHSVVNNERDQHQLKQLETDNNRLSQERMMTLKRLEKCVAAKEEMEKDLFSKFVAVLNSKKEKIRNLKENGSGEGQDEEKDDGTPVSQLNSTGNGRQNRERQVERNNEESDKEENTDEEETPPPKRQRKNVGRKTGDLDCSLDLGEDEIESSSSRIVKRPARKRGSVRTATPSKPVLPKVTRNTSNESYDGGRGRMSKSSSNNSNVSNIDPEDLFSDL